MPDWDAARYHQLSHPQVGWGRKIVERLAPQPGERILDIGCGTGRLTTEIAAQPGIFVVGVDSSSSMLAQAREGSGTPAGGRRAREVAYVRADGAVQPFQDDTFDAVFSGATFHWIVTHDRLFASIHRVLKPGGRLVAQCGGGPNLQRLLERTHHLMGQPPYARHFSGWFDPWFFAGIPDTCVRLEHAGFFSIDVSLEEAPTTLDSADEFANFISCVCVRHHVDKLPPQERAAFVNALTRLAAADDPPFTLDYWRLNISARRGG